MTTDWNGDTWTPEQFAAWLDKQTWVAHSPHYGAGGAVVNPPYAKAAALIRNQQSRLDAALKACRAMAEDGWLMFGPEGMSAPQQAVYDVLRPELEIKTGVVERRDALLDATCGHGKKVREWCDDCEKAFGRENRTQIVFEGNVADLPKYPAGHNVKGSE